MLSRRARRLVPVLIALLVAILVPVTAHAAVVPMCSEDGRSIIAPPIFVPSRGLVLEAPKPCPQPETLLMRSTPPDPGGQPTVPSAPLRAVPISPTELPAPYAGRLDRDADEASTGRELEGCIERPPRRSAD